MECGIDVSRVASSRRTSKIYSQSMPRDGIT